MLQRVQTEIGGDLRREMEFVQQFGAITSAVLITWTVWLLDPGARRKLGAAAIGCLASALCVFILKIIIGRPRPRLEDPWSIVTPWETYRWSRNDTPVTRYAWEFWERGTHDIWSMPSAHTASAFALAGVLALLYPRLRPLALTLGCIVATCRVVLGAHYITDVIIGGAIGWTVARGVAGMLLARQADKVTLEMRGRGE
jgi:membrane-associated phospholipid phosphatase